MFGGILAFALVFYALRLTALPRVTDNLHAVMYNTEWIYYRSVEAGLFDEHIGKEFLLLQKKASELREQSLLASLSFWGEFWAFCHGLSFRIMRCAEDGRRLKTRIEIILEAGLRNNNKTGEPHFLFTVPHPHIDRLQCSCKL
ncbi:hypothetical protein DFH06DRAFT_1470851 [Mycena polygramma]|nr:hypothetical protein DFH06DRAFT_1470851 [Mycena polygramma]